MADNALYRRTKQQFADQFNRPVTYDAPIESRHSLLPLGMYEGGGVSWAIPGMLYDAPESISRAFTAPARAYRGEIPDEDMIAEGLNLAGTAAVGVSVVPRPGNALASNAARLSANSTNSSLPGTLLREASDNALSPRVDNPIRASSLDELLRLYGR